MNERFYAGFGRECITPKEPTPMAGYGNTSFRKQKVIRDDLYASCVALTDGNDSTVLLYNIDLISLPEKAYDTLRYAVQAATGLCEDRILLGCTHTHSAPDLYNPEPVMERYLEFLRTAIIQAAQLALADRKECRIFVGQVETESLNFVKHYYNVDENGQKQYFGDSFGTPVMDETTAHATDADPTMHLVRLVRKGGRDLVLANWRAHATLTGGVKKYDISADFPGDFRWAMESQLGCHFLYLQGAAGNMSARSRIAEENRTVDSRAMGILLAQHAMEGLAGAQEIQPGPIRLRRTVLEGTIRHFDKAMTEAAKAVRKVWMETYDRQKAMAQRGDQPIRSVYHANAVVAREGAGVTSPIQLNAIAIGEELAIVTAPHEMFDTLSVMVEEGSPYPKTLMMGYCQNYKGYMPSKFGFEYTCYESDCCSFVPGTGEIIVENHLRMLKELKG